MAAGSCGHLCSVGLSHEDEKWGLPCSGAAPFWCVLRCERPSFREIAEGQEKGQDAWCVDTLGLERFHSVGIMGFNSAEWAIASIGAIMAGGFSVGILSTTSPKACQVIAENTDMDIFVVDNDRQLQKVTQIQSYLKHLKGIVQYKDELQVEQENLYSVRPSRGGQGRQPQLARDQEPQPLAWGRGHWAVGDTGAPSRGCLWPQEPNPQTSLQWKEFLNLAGDISDEKLDRVIDSQKPNQCCTLVYSMGSTSLSKIVMLSHDNITWTTAATVQSLCYKCPPEGQEVLVSYLPLSYIKAQIFDMWVAILVAGTLYFAPPEAGRVGMIPRPPGAVSGLLSPPFLFPLLPSLEVGG
ncbi:Hypothetical predicted protein [Marmota monax]|uniref:long-chain-fatty-acid--CoA ligase n=1 Tax=Marmota monax TaxID=9995 RepID=A0A5E4BJ44_MARMO|nr:hypothetical protein GHT09_013537 [Marmota monax]VTJ68652.1 Hypothetical predicted protein [Marmota monax]